MHAVLGNRGKNGIAKSQGFWIVGSTGKHQILLQEGSVFYMSTPET